MHKDGNIRLNVSQGIDFSSEKINLLRFFLAYCYRALQLSGTYEGNLVDDREKYSILTTAVCHPDSATFFVYAKERAFIDVLRSIAHELTHIKQHEEGRQSKNFHLRFSSGDEDEANSTAGKLVNAFSAVIGYDIIYEGKRENRTKAVGTRRDLGGDRQVRR